MAFHISLEEINIPEVVSLIQENLEEENYWNDEWSPHLYSRLAYEGLISITLGHPVLQRPVLFAQMQKEYSVLDWENLHLSRHIKRILRRDVPLKLTVDQDFAGAIEAVRSYHKPCWLTEEYMDLLLLLKNADTGCRPHSIELRDEKGALLAGEIGYQIGSIYTSLSGFLSHNKSYANYGTLQMVLLARLLQKKGFRFWNLGHPYMEYKTRLGARITGRGEFLDRWKAGRSETGIVIDEGSYPMKDLLSLEDAVLPAG